MKYKNTYIEAVNEINPSPELIRTIKMHKERKIMKFSRRKVAIIAVVACLMVSTSVFAVGQIDSLRSWSKANSDITTYDSLCETANNYGIDLIPPEGFTNGYVFAEAVVGKSEGLDAEGNKVASGDFLDIEYTKTGCPGLTLCIDPGIGEENISTALACRTINDTEVYYDEITYKFVADDYVLTAEDKKNMNDPHYEISYGDAEIGIKINSGIFFEKNGRLFNLFAWDCNMSQDEWFDMAAEFIK